MSLISPTGTLSFPSLFTPRLPFNAKPGAKARYGCVVLFAKDLDEQEKALLIAMKRAALEAATAKWGSKTEALIADGSIRWPFLKKWTDKTGNPKYDPERWQCYIQPWTEQTPGIVSRFAGPDGKPAKIIDPKDLYAGCLVKVSVNPFTYEAQGNWGVNFGLQHVQLRGDGPRLDNRLTAEDTFQAEARPEADFSQTVADGETGPAADPSLGKQGAKLADLFT